MRSVVSKNPYPLFTVDINKKLPIYTTSTFKGAQNYCDRDSLIQTKEELERRIRHGVNTCFISTKEFGRTKYKVFSACEGLATE